MARQRIIEGKWRCQSCGNEGILGRHKTCPGCGNPREQGAETEFDFGGTTSSGASTAETVTDAAALALAAAGADWHCAYCESANRGDVAACRSCGAAREEERPSAPAPQPVVAPRPRPAPRRGWFGKLLMGVAGMFVALCGLGLWVSQTTEVTGEVASLSWRRQVTRQTFTSVERAGWRDELTVQRAVMPIDGRGEIAGVEDVRGCVRKQRGTRQVPDGTRRVCSTESRQVACGTEESCTVVDQGNGFATETCRDVTKYCSESYEDCRDETQYRTEPVYGEECRYRTWEWRDGETRRLEGTDNPPRWPELKTGRLDRLARQEEYAVELAWGDGKRHTVKPATEAEFAAWKRGARARLSVNRLGSVREVAPLP